MGTLHATVEAVVRRILVVDVLQIRLAIRAWPQRYGLGVAIVPETDDLACLRMVPSPRATRSLHKSFRPVTPLSVIDECLRESGPHRKYAATLASVANACPNSTSKRQRQTGRRRKLFRVELPGTSPGISSSSPASRRRGSPGLAPSQE
jgi:hypothetical protein